MTEAVESAGRLGARSALFLAATAASDFLVTVVTARAFGADGRGTYAVASLVATLLITPLGGTSATLAADVVHRRASRGQIYAASLLVAGAGGGAIAVAAAAGAAGARALGLREHLAAALLAAACALPFLLAGLLQAAVFQACGRPRAMLCSDLARSVVPLAGLGLAWIAVDGDIYRALAIWVGAVAVAPLATLAVQRRDARFAWHGASTLARAAARRAMPFSATNAVLQLGYRVDVLVVAALLPLRDVGVYSVAVAAAEGLTLLADAIATATYDKVVLGDDAAARVAAAGRAVRHSVGLVATGGVVAVGLVALLAGEVYGAPFSDAWQPLAILVPGMIGLGIAETLRSFFVVRLESSGEYFRAASAGGVANLVAAVALVPVLGLDGAALATTLAYCGIAAYLLRRFAAHGGPGGLRGLLPGRGELRDYAQLGRSYRSGRS